MQRPPEGGGRVPAEVRAWAGERERARAARDFAAADALRERIRQAGFEVTDTPEGPVIAPRARPATRGAETAGRSGPRRVRPADVPSVLGEPPAFDASVQWMVEGWPEDVLRGIASFRGHRGSRRVQHLVLDLHDDRADGPGPAWPVGVEVIHLEPGTGWAAARNAGLVRAAGRVVVVVDGSVEATGDAVGPVVAALEDPAVGVTGPFGLVTTDLRRFEESPGPDVDAVEAYLMGFRRDLVERGLRFDEKFRFYRSADLELSFRIKDMGYRATVTPVPVVRHEHRMWANTSQPERDRLSKRNFYRFLDRWRGRENLTEAVRRRGEPGPPGPTG